LDAPARLRLHRRLLLAPLSELQDRYSDEKSIVLAGQIQA